MAIDSASQRKAISGLPFFPLGPGVTPDAAMGVEWRAYAGWGYPGLSVPPSAAPAAYLIRRLRRAPHLASENDRLFFSRFELDVETGVGNTVAPGDHPAVQLRWSDDGGQTWSEPMPASVGAIGDYEERVIWNRLGSGRVRTFEISMASPNRWRIFDAFVDVK